MIWQHTETSSKMENLPHHIFEKRPSILKNQYSINRNCPQMLIITKRIKSYPSQQPSSWVKGTHRQSCHIGSRDLSVESFGLNTIKTTKRGYKRWSAHEEKIRGSNIMKTFFCPLRPFRSLTKPLKNTKDHLSQFLSLEKINVFNTQFSSKRQLNQLFPLQILPKQKHSVSQPMRVNWNREQRAKKMKNSMVVKRQDSPQLIRGWDINKTQQEFE